ncbi:MAG: hypothetical protein HZA48_04140 [Planctomycetes bacterium]|nr:hypothetical protein [Planctomycetota bacterium]
MVRFNKITLVFAFLFLFTGMAGAEKMRIMPVSEIKTGMRGYGLSVFKGVEIEKFDIEVVSVMRNKEPKLDAILIRCFGPVVEHANIIAGMSGSPIFIDDKLIGALAFGWGFSMDPIAGVTPVENMIDDADRPLETAFDFNSKIYYADSVLKPVQTPMFVSGFSPDSMKILQDAFAGYGIVPMQAAGTSNSNDPELQNISLEPGSAIGFQLIRGDMEATAVGTVTYVDGNKVVAFGHPFFNGGEISLPMTTAYVHTVLANNNMSFKIASAVKDVGASQQDRNTCITGIMGNKARMFPVTVKMSVPASEFKREYRMEVVDHPSLTVSLVYSVAASVFESVDKSMTKSVINYGYKINLKNHEKPLVLNGSYTLYAGTDLDPRALLGTLNALNRNPFAQVEIESIEMDFTVKHTDTPVMVIKDAWLSQNEIVAGQKAKIKVVFKPEREDNEITEEFEFDVPDYLKKDDKIFIAVSNGQMAAPETAPATNVNEFLDNLNKYYMSTEIVLDANLPGKNVLRMKGSNLPDLPNTVLALWQPNTENEFTFDQKRIRLTRKTGYLVAGSKQLVLKVKQGREQ